VGGAAEPVAVCRGPGADRAGRLQHAEAAARWGNIVYDALTSRGLVTPPHSTVVGSSIASDNRNDQVAMFPETSRKWLVNIGVFDFDAVVFRDLWERKGQQVFNEYGRYILE